jgi:hypothetical protein
MRFVIPIAIGIGCLLLIALFRLSRSSTPMPDVIEPEDLRD